MLAVAMESFLTKLSAKYLFHQCTASYHFDMIGGTTWRFFEHLGKVTKFQKLGALLP